MSPPETGIRSRPDLPSLWDFVEIAAYEPDAGAAKAVPFVAAHLAGWQRPEDFGFIAERDGVALARRGRDCGGGPTLQSRSFKVGPLPDLLNNVIGNDS
jgi:hypothetical protein